MQSISDNIHTDIVHRGLGCGIVNDRIGDLFVQSISDTSHTDKISLGLGCETVNADIVSVWCEPVYVYSGYSSLQSIFDNIHTHMVSLWCEPLHA